MKLLITGGSGFIGTNLISELIKQENIKILNFDLVAPKIKSHSNLWRKLDIREKQDLLSAVEDFDPNFVIHLAAKTDLNGKTLKDYDSNTVGVNNLLEVLENLNSLKRVIFVSSMYVCEPGYTPQSNDDYKPHTIYGESKVQFEKIIKKYDPKNYGWCIVRPTSIWGPWFGEPYANFFNIVISKNYMHLGSKTCTKTYGYVGNTIFQILGLINAENQDINEKTFYLGDWPAYNISHWADEIAKQVNITIPKVPFALFRVAAWVGDLLKMVGIKFPMTSFRLKNMTTDNIHDLSMIRNVVSELPYTRQKGIELTLEWIKLQKSK